MITIVRNEEQAKGYPIVVGNPKNQQFIHQENGIYICHSIFSNVIDQLDGAPHILPLK